MRFVIRVCDSVETDTHVTERAGNDDNRVFSQVPGLRSMNVLERSTIAYLLGMAGMRCNDDVIRV